MYDIKKTLTVNKMAAALNQQRPEMDLPLFLLPRSSNPSSLQRLISVLCPEMLLNPLRLAVSWAWMCRRGPLSSIGPPCLLSPYRVSTARAFSAPERREGGRAGEGGGEREKSREQMSVVHGCWSSGPMVTDMLYKIADLEC